LRRIKMGVLEKMAAIKEQLKTSYKESGGFQGMMPNSYKDTSEHKAGNVESGVAPDGPLTRMVMTDDQTRRHVDFNSLIGTIGTDRGETYGDGHTNDVTKNASLDDDVVLEAIIAGIADSLG